MKEPSGSFERIFSAASPEMGPQYQPYWKNKKQLWQSNQITHAKDRDHMTYGRGLVNFHNANQWSS
jgi:hypothetical protein